MNKDFKSGFVSLVGRTNVGKSTLLNALAKEKIASFLPFDSIEENMIMMDMGDKFVMLVGANGVNYYLMSDIEKESVEGGFIQILNSLRFPIQIYVQTTSVNLDKSLELYKDRRKAMEENLIRRAQDLQFMIREGDYDEDELDEKRFEIEKFKILNCRSWYKNEFCSKNNKFS